MYIINPLNVACSASAMSCFFAWHLLCNWSASCVSQGTLRTTATYAFGLPSGTDGHWFCPFHACIADILTIEVVVSSTSMQCMPPRMVIFVPCPQLSRLLKDA